MADRTMNRPFGIVKKITTHFYFLVCLSSFIIVSGCGSNQTISMDIEGNIQATSVLNPDIKGEYKPVNIKVYYLKSDTEFSQAGFADLYKYTDKVLGDSILHISSHQLLPGQTIELEEEVPMGLKYIGVVAAFRHLQNATWKDIKPIPEKCFFCTGPGLWDPITIKVDRLSIQLDLGNE
tara:strand:- start:17981 stop:18517 length:537 start_codon:yes stop_codon:yes gene_type:complete